MQAWPPDPTPVLFSVKLYGFLVRAYPSSFRCEYGDLMVQVFRDSCLRAHRQLSVIGLLALWCRTLVDTFLSVIEQYSNKGADMTRSNLIKLSGWFLAASSPLFLLGLLAGSRPEYNQYNALSLPIDGLLNIAAGPLFILGALSIIVGTLGLKSFLGNRAGGLGKTGLNISLIGAAAAIAGMIGMVISDNEPWWITTMIGLTGVFIGLFLFGIRCLRDKLFSRWNILPLLTGIIWPMLVLVDLLVLSEMPETVSLMVILISFIGIGLVGYQLQTETRKITL